MQFIGYSLAYAFMWFLHIMPLPVLAVFSEIFYFLLYPVAGYRKKVVMHNLSLAFPEQSPKERKKLARAFYRYLADFMLESAFSHFDSDRKLLKRFTVKNPEVLQDLHQKNKPVVAVTAHYANWEPLCTMGHYSPYKVLAAYKPLRNKYFDRMVKENRERFGTVTLPMEKIARGMIEHKRDGIPAFSIFVADQRPRITRPMYWTQFLGQKSSFFIGSERMARKIDAAVVFVKIRKLKRFHYEAELELICENPAEMEDNAITEAHVRILEKLIREEPAYWLWSHRRWKYSYEDFLNFKARSNP